MANPRISGILKALLAGGLKRRIFSTFDRNRYPDPLAAGELSLTEEIVENLLASEQMLRTVSKTVGFNQITIAPVSSLDLAEICWYEALDQPGIKPIFSFYASKKFRIYLNRYMAGDELSAYIPAESLPKVIGSGFPDITLAIENGTQNDLRVEEKTNQFSYGARIKRMKDDMILQYVMQLSEEEFTESYGEERLLNQQALSDGLVVEGTSPKAPGKNILRSIDPMMIQDLLRTQAEIEQTSESLKRSIQN